MNELHIFVGPSINANFIKPYNSNAEVRPPVQLGDLSQFGAGHTVVILDGYFSQVPAIWHKEIMWAMSRGCRVIGGASMGALRAAELADYGMEGIGWVFQQYRQGIIQDDDEVALVHADASLGFRPLSLALVDLRYLLTTSLCNEPQQSLLNWLIAALKSEFYPKRTLARCQHLLQTQQVEHCLIADLLEKLQQPQWRIKQQDALQAIEVAQQPKTSTAVAVSPEVTVFLQQILSTSSPLAPLSSQHLLAKLLSIWSASKSDHLAATPALVQQQLNLWCQARALVDHESVLSWLQQHGLKTNDLQNFLRLLAKLSMAENSPQSSTFYRLLQEI